MKQGKGSIFSRVRFTFETHKKRKIFRSHRSLISLDTLHRVILPSTRAKLHHAHFTNCGLAITLVYGQAQHSLTHSLRSSRKREKTSKEIANPLRQTPLKSTHARFTPPPNRHLHSPILLQQQHSHRLPPEPPKPHPLALQQPRISTVKCPTPTTTSNTRSSSNNNSRPTTGAPSRSVCARKGTRRR